MSQPQDPKGNQFYAEYGSFYNGSGAAIAKGVPVAIEADGDIIATATANLHHVIGVAAKAIPDGESGLVLLKGYCDYLVTDGGVAVATDLAIQVLDAGTTGGVTSAELIATPTLCHNILGVPLADDTGNVGIAWINPGGVGSGAT